MTEAAPFDVCGPLPSGVTVLEASAGTGKTFTIAALAARYVAAGVPLDQVLMVTFTRMATGELRERVRERLVSAEHGLERALAGAPPEDDAIVGLLASGSEAEVRLRRERLVKALAGFDSATIATTHGFCQEVLGGLGVVGDVEPDTTFVEDISDLRQEVVEDLYVRRFHRHGDPQFPLAQALEIARAAIDNPDAPIEPAGAPENSIAAMRVRLAGAARAELELRKRRMALMTYDDLLTRLKGTLTGPGGPDAAARLRVRYRVVLVDEFQDTDPVQWEIMRTAFGTGDVTLVLIGDPKQAIYAFRGADVYAYIEAARTAGAQRTLRTNWRSDQGLLTAYDALFGNARLGHEGIVYRQVAAAPENRAVRLTGAPDPAPLRVRVVPRAVSGTTPRGFARVESARVHVAADVAADIVELLESEARIVPGQIAVLVRTNKNAARVRDALEAVDVPAVINGAGSVFGTEPAREWLRLLEAIERPAYPPRAHSAALTTFLGWTAERVAEADDDEWEAVHQRLHHWARVLRAKGVASLIETITLGGGTAGPRPGAARRRAADDGPPPRRRAPARGGDDRVDGRGRVDRLAAPAGAGGGAGQRRRGAQPAAGVRRRGGPGPHRAPLQGPRVPRRLLPGPVGAVPDAADGPPRAGHVPRRGRHPDVDVGLEGPQWSGHVRQNVEEQRGEDLRLAYVALTRAKHQAVVWWAGSFDSRNSALTRLLFSRDADGGRRGRGELDADRCRGDRALRAAARRGARVRQRRLVAVALDRAVAGPAGAAGDAVGGRVRPDARLVVAPHVLQRHHRRHLRGARRAASRRSPSSTTSRRAARPRPRSSTARTTLRAVPSLLAGMPVGVEVGTLVHRVFELTDFAAPDLDAELAVNVDAAQARRRVELGDAELAAAGLRAALETPLGPAVANIRLRDVARSDRLDELAFELPLVGGDDPTGPALTLGTIAEVLRASTGDALAGYADRLADPGLRASVRGYLTGSIDLVVRVAGGRYAIVDYKTNWLAPPGEPLTAWHHRPAALAAEMEHAHYGLQALLYVVALHRFLRWRVPGYSAERHLAGVLYLFVRGMTGPETPLVDGMPCGVFAWRPSGALVEALSDAFDRGTAP